MNAVSMSCRYLMTMYMPLIRYNQADNIIIDEHHKTCEGRLVKIVGGRSCDKIVLNNDKEISSYTLKEIISDVNNRFRDVIEYWSFKYYKNAKRLECRIYIEPLNLPMLSTIKNALHSMLVFKVGDTYGLIFDILLLNKEDIEQCIIAKNRCLYISE